MPQLTLLSAAATGVGTAFGGKSLANIFTSEHKAHKMKSDIRKNTRIPQLLYGAYKRNNSIYCVYTVW